MSTTAAVVHARLSERPLSVDDILRRVSAPGAGAVVFFVGIVRDHDGGRDGVVELGYSAHPSAEDRLRDTVAAVAGRDGVLAAAAEHRTGTLQVGDLAVVCAASAAHRPAAFEAARDLIEQVKAQVPIWKHQTFADGDSEWVGV